MDTTTSAGRRIALASLLALVGIPACSSGQRDNPAGDEGDGGSEVTMDSGGAPSSGGRRGTPGSGGSAMAGAGGAILADAAGRERSQVIAPAPSRPRAAGHPAGRRPWPAHPGH